jgi:hypothetical protein
MVYQHIGSLFIGRPENAIHSSGDASPQCWLVGFADASAPNSLKYAVLGKGFY